ncbi:serine/threonine protein kinase [Klebsormidium nitens]|uniref:non-specific serine/threonine protein kinase n=1 Tax=Klebsormidium nitens TaxID=105231 RepID=A0A0U9HSD0_KLENI|nr:serine/threonine protein kinase [Klebsormidium nitens]|eukprot:GAQ83678.1 serine/threonine protein kinase [Klebsormidium nitens]
MGCTLSVWSTLYDSVVPNGSDVWIGDRRFRVVKELGEGGFAFVYLVKEMPTERPQERPTSYVADDGQYAMKKFLIQTEEQLQLVKQEVVSSTRFQHPNLLPLLEHSIITVKDKHVSPQGALDGNWTREAYFLFPVYREGTLQDAISQMQETKDCFSAPEVLQILKQICGGLLVMHSSDPPFAHNDIKPGNVLLERRSGNIKAVIMDYGSVSPARRKVSTRKEALVLQEWAAEHCTAPYRAPELFDTPSSCEIDERTDVWSLGCTLYAIMYHVNPFEFAVNDKGGGGSLALAAISGRVQWPTSPVKSYPPSFHDLVLSMLNTDWTRRPHIRDLCRTVENMISTLPPEM